MPNATNINTAMELYSTSFIEELSPRLPALGSFSLDLSDEVVEPGNVIRVPLVESDPAGDWDDATNNYDRDKADLKDRKVPLNKRIIAGFGISQDQLTNFRPHWWEGKGRLNARSVANSVLQHLFANVTAAKFGSKAVDRFAIELASFNPEVVAALRAQCDDKNIDPTTAALMLSPAYFSKLLGTLSADVYGGREALVTGHIPGLLGFQSIQEAPQLKIPGFVGEASALAIASRRVPVADTTPYMEFGAITEPDTGLILNRVIYTDGKTGKTSFSVECMFGSEAGNRDALIRLIDGTPAPAKG